MKTLATIISVLGIFIILAASNSPNEKEKLTYEISYEYWDTCHVGPNPCQNFTFTRAAFGDSIEIVLPCGGTETSVFLFKDTIQNRIENQHLYYNDCPPIFDLTHLEDGTYGFYMLACNLGGGIRFHLKSEEN